MIRERVNRLLGFLIATTLEHLPVLEQFVSARTDTRRLHIALWRLRRHGLQIEIVYDIGAHRGHWTESVRASLPGARFFLFEANDAHTNALQATGEPYFTAILSSEEKLVEFYSTGSPGDSYFREATEHYIEITPKTLRATTLDHMIETHDIPYPDFIKADVQGAEVDVLRGGQNALSNAKLVLLECPIVEYNECAPNIHEYVRFMHECGFTPIDFPDRIWRNEQMVQVDILFARIGATRGFIP